MIQGYMNQFHDWIPNSMMKKGNRRAFLSCDLAHMWRHSETTCPNMSNDLKLFKEVFLFYKNVYLAKYTDKDMCLCNGVIDYKWFDQQNAVHTTELNEFNN